MISHTFAGVTLRCDIDLWSLDLERLLHYITLQLSRVEWLKYRTTKPLLYTMFRTRNREQLRRKWSGKVISFEAVPKNNQRWSWGDVGVQTLREAASSHRKVHDRQQWTAVYVGSIAARMTTTGDGGGWNRRRAGCNRKNTVCCVIACHVIKFCTKRKQNRTIRGWVIDYLVIFAFFSPHCKIRGKVGGMPRVVRGFKLSRGSSVWDTFCAGSLCKVADLTHFLAQISVRWE